jgi:GlpG protein
LIAISVTVFILSRFGVNHESLQSLFITQYLVGGGYINPYPDLPEIRHGELWRLVTPIFIHFTPLHIIFNMMWLRDLGSMIEARRSTLQLALLTLVIAAGSNLAQYYFGHAPNFGGMSGVVYGLLGYVWIRGKLDPGSGLGLHPSTVIMMMLWLVAGFARLLGPIANSAHLSGLVIGVVWGWLSSLRSRSAS